MKREGKLWTGKYNENQEKVRSARNWPTDKLI